MIAQKCTPNQRNKNNLKDNHLIRTNTVRLSLGEYQNVFLTEKEYKRLKADFAGLDALIEPLSAYIQSTDREVCRPCRNAAHLGEAATIREKESTGISRTTLLWKEKAYKVD